MPDFLSVYAASQGDKPAIIDDRTDGTVTTVTFAELDDRSNRLANLLLALGVRPGESKVVWCGQNSPGLVVMISAARKLGITAVPLNYRLSDEEATYVTDHCDASIVYCDVEQTSMFERIRAQLPKVDHYLVFAAGDSALPNGMTDVDSQLDQASAAEPEIPANTEPGATMIYTTGTTGKPKGAYRRANQGAEAAMELVAKIGYRPDDVYIPTGPLYHSGPLGFMGIGQALGQTVIIQRKFDPLDWLRPVRTHKDPSAFAAP